MSPTTARKSTVKSSKHDNLAQVIDTARESVAAKNGSHTMPALAALVSAARKVGGDVSQMSLGTNKTKEGKAIVPNLKTPADTRSGEKGALKSGWFSLIANIEQGGRKTAIPSEFVTYLSTFLGVSEDVVTGAINEDAEAATALAKANEAKTPAPANA